MLSRNTFRLNLSVADQRRGIALATAFCRSAPVLAESKKNEGESSEITLENAKPFESIPGPSKFEFLRGVLPGGIYFNKSLTELINIMNSKYGTLIRMPGMFGRPETYIDLNPKDYSTIFRNEGQWPFRRGLDTLSYYRLVHRKDLFQGVEGVTNSNGEKWGEMRTAVNPILMQPKNVKFYLNTMLEVNDEFLARIREIRDPKTQEMPDTFEEEINRLTFESVAAVALNTQLGLIRKNRDTPEAKLLLTHIRKFFELVFDLDVMPSIWKYVATPKFKELMETLDILTDICMKYIDDATLRIEREKEGKLTSDATKEKSVLEKLLVIDRKVAVVMAMDMMLAGVDTTSSTLTGILFCIGTNPEKQKILFEEIKQILPEKNSRLTNENMRSLPYLRACIKEGMRMYPILPGTLRRLPHDVVLSGYRFKKGHDVTVSSNILLNNEEYVPRPKEFLPERWLRVEGVKNSLSGAIANPFMFLPFGFGPRICIGRRLVDLEVEITLARLVRNFNIEFNYPLDKPFKAKFINVPNIPLKFKFEERNE